MNPLASWATKGAQIAKLVTFCQECSSSLHASSCQIEFVKWKISGAQPPSVKSAFSRSSSMRIDHFTEVLSWIRSVEGIPTQKVGVDFHQN